MGKNKKVVPSAKFIKASEILKQKATRIREYEVIRKPEERQRLPIGVGSEYWIDEPEYIQAVKLKERLIREFEGEQLENTFAGQVVSNNFGECYCIQDVCSSHFKKVAYEQSKKRIISDLKLVYGIGPIWERRLKQQGYVTIENLREHPRWRSSALQFLELIEDNDVGSLQNWLWRCLPKSHPLVHYLASFCRDEDFALLDIETLGLFGRAIVLLGVAKPKKNSIDIHQYLLRDIADEPGALWEFISHLTEKTALITFNGRSFDVPFIRERLGFYGMVRPLNNPHFDLLHFSRRAWRDQLPDCQLGTLEKHLGVQRDVDIPSALVPEFYETYLKTGNVGPLVAIVEHNKQDLITMTSLFSKLYEAWNL
ncbi:MAG: ribonuclease H-like domain-containing protein [Candidatus Bathyarchaeota archaeon]|nr:MAG: ribonuclease H-like domain-containing protein [Candidatus Bathyarchaeota archaeon]